MEMKREIWGMTGCKAGIYCTEFYEKEQNESVAKVWNERAVDAKRTQAVC